MVHRYVAFTNADVYGTEFTTIIVKDNVVEAIGGGELLTRYGKLLDRIIDVGGRTLLPGIIDAHMHLLGTLQTREYVDLRNCRSIDELKHRIKLHVRRVGSGKWIIGRGWDQSLFRERRFPTRWDLDEVAPDNPVLIIRVCGHVGIANSKALRVAGISRDTPNPEGGVIDRDERGEPTGILYEKALDLVVKCIPKPSTEELCRNLYNLMLDFVEYGITCVHTMSADRYLVKALAKLASEKNLPIRVRMYLREDEFDLLYRQYKGFGNEFFKVVGVKIFADGSLGGWTAALREPYSDNPSTSGTLTITESSLRYWLSRALNEQFQVAVHAIGDRALELVLRVAETIEASKDMLRIEHASLTPPDIIEKLQKVKPIIVVQPHFLVSDWWVESRLGNRARYVYAYRTLLSAGLELAGSSDSPVEPYNPWLGISAAMTRANLACISKDEALTLDQAISIYTQGSAKASKEYGVLGCIEPGCLADFIILEDDIKVMNPYDVSAVRLHMTVIDGKVMYKKPKTE